VDRDAVPVLAVGDSYTQGHGVQAELAWPKRLEARLSGVHVYNAGVSGYGLQQMRRTAEVFAPRFGARAVFVGLYGHGYSRVTEPYVVVGEGAGLVRRSEAERVGVEDDGFLLPVFESARLRAAGFWIDRHWRLAGTVMHALLGPRVAGGFPRAERESPGREALEHAMAPMLQELEALRADTERWHAPLVVLLINPVEPDGSVAPLQRGYNEIIGEFARAHGICSIDPLPRFAAASGGRTLRLGSDPHWSPLAHQLAADLVVEVLQQSLAEGSPDLHPCGDAARVVLRP
jgi:hypothetical protein